MSSSAGKAPYTQLHERFTLGNEVGTGGMSIVRQAHDKNLKRTVAIKTLRPRYADDSSVRKRLLDEAQIAAQLEHPSVIPVYELGIDVEGSLLSPNALYFTMLLVRGRTLAHIVREENEGGGLFENLQSFIKVCEAVSLAHDRGVIHRDIKPDNIMVGQFGEVYLMDWGLAKVPHYLKESQPGTNRVLVSASPGHPMTQNGMPIGTLAYASPEQALGHHMATDERSDVFGLGATLYFLLTATPPHLSSSGSLDNLQDLAITCNIEPPERRTDRAVPRGLAEVALRCMKKNPSERFQSVRELKGQIDSFLKSGL